MRQITVITADISSSDCGKEIIETIPLLMDYIRGSVRKHTGSGSSISQVRALAYLKRFPGATLSGVADFLAVSNPTASSVIERLVQRGLVNRQTDPKERRCVRLDLTASGRKHIDEINQFAIKELSVLISKLSESKTRKIFDGLSILKECLTSSKEQ